MMASATADDGAPAPAAEKVAPGGVGKRTRPRKIRPRSQRSRGRKHAKNHKRGVRGRCKNKAGRTKHSPPSGESSTKSSAGGTSKPAAPGRPLMSPASSDSELWEYNSDVYILAHRCVEAPPLSPLPTSSLSALPPCAPLAPPSLTPLPPLPTSRLASGPALPHVQVLPLPAVEHVDARKTRDEDVWAPVRRGLARPGAGILSMAGLLRDAVLSLVERGVTRVAAWKAKPIFNSQSVDEMEALGADAEVGRRQALLPDGPAKEAVDAAAGSLCELMHAAYGRRYMASPAKVLINLPGAPRQTPHGDTGDDKELGNPPRMVGVVMAVDDRADLDAWLDEYCDDVNDDSIEVVSSARAHRVHITAGGIVLFRGDVIHRGVENVGRARYLRRVHMYLLLCDGSEKLDWGDGTCPVVEVP